jgi:hypothetical protein
VYTISVQVSKEIIVDALREHPEGLTHINLSKIISSHRHTVSKYICQLIVEGLIYTRDIGSAKLCYLKEEYDGKRD